MNIKILDSWLREFLETGAKPEKIAEALSLTSVAVERMQKYGKNDLVYDIEVTTNRPDLMSVEGIAREAAVVLPQFGVKAQFKQHTPKQPKVSNPTAQIHIKNNPKLVNRINAVVMEVSLKDSPQYIKDRLESTDIRSLNNLIDVTNYVMRETGHPAHVFDYDRLTTKQLIIRESDKGEQIVTLDEKVHKLPGGDIIADNGEGEIVDLLGVMGTANSVVTEETKRILFFLDNNEPHHIRKTSMSLGIRTEAAQLNEKGVDPELMFRAFLRGIELYTEIADGKIISDLIDIYPNKVKTPTVSVTLNKINEVIGVDIPAKQSLTILNDLGFEAKLENDEIVANVPSWRADDVQIPEDLVEEIARIYGYHNIPTELPPQNLNHFYHLEKDPFYWEHKVKGTLRDWGFDELYTYSMVSENLYEGNLESAVKLKNPLTEEHIYMRNTLIPSLLVAVSENENRETIKVFELANTYHKRAKELPEEILQLALVIKKPQASFFEIKGLVEQLFASIGITNYAFKPSTLGGAEADVYIGKEKIGEIEQVDIDVIDAEINFQKLLEHVSLSKKYTPLAKYPPIIEDIRLQLKPEITYAQIVETINHTSPLVTDVELLDVYQDKKTFRIIYQSPKRNLTNEEVAREREKILKKLKEKLNAKQV